MAKTAGRNSLFDSSSHLTRCHDVAGGGQFTRIESSGSRANLLGDATCWPRSAELPNGWRIACKRKALDRFLVCYPGLFSGSPVARLI